MDYSDRAFVAYHEAGHAVLGFLFGRDIETLSIVQDGDRAGGVLIDTSGDDELRNTDEGAFQIRAEQQIMVSLAGDIAQRLFDAASVEDGGDESDQGITSRYLDALNPETDEIRDAYAALLQLRAEALVKGNWQRVERIAALLIARGTITGGEAQLAFVDPQFRHLAG